MEPGVLINQANYLSNLSFDVWRDMKGLVQFYPVFLDLNTAGPFLDLSEDLSSVRAGERRPLPENPERIGNFSVNVTSFPEVVSGRLTFDVEVGGNKNWAVGARGQVQRGGNTETGAWWIRFIDDKYSARSHPGPGERALPDMKLQRVRVKLDFDTNTLTFSDPDTNTDLHTVTDTFTGQMVPFLRTEDHVPLRILPKDITVNV